MSMFMHLYISKSFLPTQSFLSHALTKDIQISICNALLTTDGHWILNQDLSELWLDCQISNSFNIIKTGFAYIIMLRQTWLLLQTFNC